MASGLPVVAVNDPAIADAVTDGVNGFLTPQRADALAEAADRVLTDPSLRTAMAAESRKRAEELDIDRMAEKLAGLYAELVRAHPYARKSLAAPAVQRVGRQISRLRRRGRMIVRRYL
jgi:glycosyltransferase involved in cell wall biosynthesis